MTDPTYIHDDVFPKWVVGGDIRAFVKSMDDTIAKARDDERDLILYEIDRSIRHSQRMQQTVKDINTDEDLTNVVKIWENIEFVTKGLRDSIADNKHRTNTEKRLMYGNPDAPKPQGVINYET